MSTCFPNDLILWCVLLNRSSLMWCRGLVCGPSAPDLNILWYLLIWSFTYLSVCLSVCLFLGGGGLLCDSLCAFLGGSRWCLTGLLCYFDVSLALSCVWRWNCTLMSAYVSNIICLFVSYGDFFFFFLPQKLIHLFMNACFCVPTTMVYLG